jgi:hypothetical protein
MLEIRYKLCVIFVLVSAAPSFIRRLRSWRRPLSGVLILVVCGWLLAFATHFHVAGEDHPSKADSAHICEMCSALAVGAPVTAPTISFFAGRPVVPAKAQPVVVRSVALCASYQSRAPPSA